MHATRPKLCVNLIDHLILRLTNKKYYTEKKKCPTFLFLVSQKTLFDNFNSYFLCFLMQIYCISRGVPYQLITQSKMAEKNQLKYFSRYNIKRTVLEKKNDRIFCKISKDFSFYIQDQWVY